MANLLQLRKKQAYGEERDYFDHPSCIAVVLSNGDKGFKSIEIGKKFARNVLRDALGHCEGEVLINEKGWGEFHCEAGSVSVWAICE